MATKTEAGRVLADLIAGHGWEYVRLARAAGVSEALIRKYATGGAVRPKATHVWRIARAFGSRDGAKLLYAFGFDDLAQDLARQDISPMTPIEEVPEPVDLSIDERLARLEEAVEELRELLVSNNAKPG